VRRPRGLFGFADLPLFIAFAFAFSVSADTGAIVTVMLTAAMFGLTGILESPRQGAAASKSSSHQLQPAETLWALVDEPIVNQHIATITDLDEKIAAQCIALSEQREQIQSRTGFHWWPKRIAPN
jgi:hypothetical protein